MVYRAALRIVGQRSDAEDVVQEVFFEVHRRHWPQGADNWEALLRTMATRRALDSVRRRKVKLRPLGSDLEQRGAEPEESARLREFEELVRAGIARLPRQQAEVITLHCLEGSSHQEIARELRISLHSVASALHKARTRLAKYLAVHITNCER